MICHPEWNAHFAIGLSSWRLTDGKRTTDWTAETRATLDVEERNPRPRTSGQSFHLKPSQEMSLAARAGKAAAAAFNDRITSARHKMAKAFEAGESATAETKPRELRGIIAQMNRVLQLAAREGVSDSPDAQRLRQRQMELKAWLEQQQPKTTVSSRRTGRTKSPRKAKPISNATGSAVSYDTARARSLDSPAMTPRVDGRTIPSSKAALSTDSAPWSERGSGDLVFPTPSGESATAPSAADFSSKSISPRMPRANSYDFMSKNGSTSSPRNSYDFMPKSGSTSSPRNSYDFMSKSGSTSSPRNSYDFTSRSGSTSSPRKSISAKTRWQRAARRARATLPMSNNDENDERRREELTLQARSIVNELLEGIVSRALDGLHHVDEHFLRARIVIAQADALMDKSLLCMASSFARGEASSSAGLRGVALQLSHALQHAESVGQGKSAKATQVRERLAEVTEMASAHDAVDSMLEVDFESVVSAAELRELVREMGGAANQAYRAGVHKSTAAKELLRRWPCAETRLKIKDDVASALRVFMDIDVDGSGTVDVAELAEITLPELKVCYERMAVALQSGIEVGADTHADVLELRDKTDRAQNMISTREELIEAKKLTESAALATPDELRTIRKQIETSLEHAQNAGVSSSIEAKVLAVEPARLEAIVSVKDEMAVAASVPFSLQSTARELTELTTAMENPLQIALNLGISDCPEATFLKTKRDELLALAAAKQDMLQTFGVVKLSKTPLSQLKHAAHQIKASLDIARAIGALATPEATGLARRLDSVHAATSAKARIATAQDAAQTADASLRRDELLELITELSGALDHATGCEIPDAPEVAKLERRHTELKALLDVKEEIIQLNALEIGTRSSSEDVIAARDRMDLAIERAASVKASDTTEAEILVAKRNTLCAIVDALTVDATWPVDRLKKLLARMNTCTCEAKAVMNIHAAPEAALLASHRAVLESNVGAKMELEACSTLAHLTRVPSSTAPALKLVLARIKKAFTRAAAVGLDRSPEAEKLRMWRPELEQLMLAKEELGKATTNFTFAMQSKALITVPQLAHEMERMTEALARAQELADVSSSLEEKRLMSKIDEAENTIKAKKAIAKAAEIAFVKEEQPDFKLLATKCHRVDRAVYRASLVGLDSTPQVRALQAKVAEARRQLPKDYEDEEDGPDEEDDRTIDSNDDMDGP